jgi:hypothetical protein
MVGDDRGQKFRRQVSAFGLGGDDVPVVADDSQRGFVLTKQFRDAADGRNGIKSQQDCAIRDDQETQTAAACDDEPSDQVA